MDNRYDSFTILISKINKNIRKIRNNEMKKYNLKNSHISCIFYLYINKKLTAHQLCEKCDEDKATISRTLLFLEESGYIECQSNNTKRYNSYFMLTSKGLEIGKIITDKIDNILELANVMTENERISFYEKLCKISECLDNINNDIENKENKND